MARRARARLGWLAVPALLLVGSAVGPGPVLACRAIPVPFEAVVDRAPRIFVVTVASRLMDGGMPEAYTLVVREAIRGAVPDDVDLPTVITIPAPVITACGDVLDVDITTHLVLAMDVPAFADGKPLTVPWILKPDGSLTGGWDDGPATWVDLVAFRAALEHQAFETPAPTRPPDPDAPVPGQGTPLASMGIVAGVVVGVIVALGIVVIARRGSRARNTPPGGW